MSPLLYVIAGLTMLLGVLGWRSCSQAGTIDELKTAHTVDEKSVHECGDTLALSRQDLDACNTRIDSIAEVGKLADQAADARAHAIIAPTQPKATAPRVETVQEMNQWFASVQQRLR